MSDSLTHSAARGLLFTLSSQGAKILLQLLSVAVLARLLDPHDYGLMALVLVVVGAGEVFRDFGLTAASIQAVSLSPGQRDRLFWINAGVGVVLAALVFVSAWPAAAVTGEPAVLGMLHVLSALFIVNGLFTQHRAGLLRDLRFRAIAITDILAAFIGLGVAVGTALAGWAYWALVAQQLAVGVVTLVCVVAAGRWIPGWRPAPEGVRSLVSFGTNIVATNLIVYAGSRVDTVLVGLRFGTSSLGIYNRAFQLVMTPLNQIRGPINNVAQPVFARVQKDQPTFTRYVVSGQLALGYGIGVPLAAVAALAVPVVDVMLGQGWSQAAPILALFAVAALFSNLALIGYWVYISRGLVKDLFRYTLVSLLIRVICLLAGSTFGPVGVAAGFALAPFLSWPLSIWWLSRRTPMPVRQLYLGAARVVALTVPVALAVWAVSIATAFLPSLIVIALGLLTAAVLLGASMLLPIYRSDFRTLLSFGRLMLKRRGNGEVSKAEEETAQ